MALKTQIRFEITGYDVQVPDSGPVVTVHSRALFPTQNFELKLPDVVFTGAPLAAVMKQATTGCAAYVAAGVDPAIAYYQATRDALYVGMQVAQKVPSA